MRRTRTITPAKLRIILDLFGYLLIESVDDFVDVYERLGFPPSWPIVRELLHRWSKMSAQRSDWWTGAVHSQWRDAPDGDR